MSLRALRPLLSAFAAAVALASCKGGASLVGGSENGEPFDPTGSFMALSVNVEDGQVWELNRPIRITFNHPVDPLTISFATIQIRAMDAGAAGQPVTGSFELESGEDGRVVVFRPVCPTDDANSNGSFLGGGVRYELSLPTEASGAATVLRDTSGRPLEVGLRKEFVTPVPPTQQLFLDLTPGPPLVTSVDFPEGLNLWSAPDPIVRIRFDQSIDGSPSNLSNSNLQLRFSDGEVGSGLEDTFPAENLIPGRLVLVENCVASGATVDFVITGVLPPNRNLQLRVADQFRDIVGQTNTTVTLWPSHRTPTLAEIYQDPSWNESDVTYDEFRDDYDDSSHIDLAAEIPLPFATVGDGYVAASFDFPGSFVSDEVDFLVDSPFREIFTDSVQPFTDDSGRQHYLTNGVLEVNDLTITSGSVLRARGKNPLVIYATGDVVIDGKIDISGNNSTWPSSLQSPQFAEGGAGGECGGGAGGDASQVLDAETPRAESGDGPFGLTHAGGQGGEGVYGDGSFNVDNLLRNIAAGGGGGGFARTLNMAIFRDDWPNAGGWHPAGVDNQGPDHIASRHPQVDVVWVPDPTSPIYGAEDGMRGNSADNNDPPDQQGSAGGYGIEDLLRDDVAVEDVGNIEPGWTSGDTPPFSYGHPTKGPDPGVAGPSPFAADGDFSNDFWGRRLNTDGSVTVGELTAPWAGSGGGGGGDAVMVRRLDTDGDGNKEPVSDFIPLDPFQNSGNGNTPGWVSYRKGAGGGGGAGQLLIFAIGKIKLGATGSIVGNGGIGFSGESIINTDKGVSGSGGGSGGHIVLHTNTALDLSEIFVGSASNSGEIGNLTANPAVTVYGGRRGWAGPNLIKIPNTAIDDGNGDFMIGRGGAGANGIIQIHVPNPNTDIIWPPDAAPGIRDYVGNNPVDTDRLEEMLGLFTVPDPYALIPFFSSASMMQSTWIDTGYAGLRLSPDSDPQNWIYPQFADPTLRFEGTAPSGVVLKSGENVAPLGEVASGANSAADYDSFAVSLSGAAAAFAPEFLRNPELLVGYDLLPNRNGASTFEITAASYDRGADRLDLSTRVSDGPLPFAVGGAAEWGVRRKFFRLETSGLKDYLPNSTLVQVVFQGAKERTPGSNEPGDPFPGPNVWTADLADLDGYRFIRYRVTFEADALGQGISLSSPLPLLEYLKVPYAW